MIAVIADDLTGAAELGGVGLKYGLNVEIQTGSVNHTKADLLVISTDSRSMNAEDAVAVSESVIRSVASLKPDFIFKKIDSALRGHVTAEVDAMLSVLRLKRALLLPANPALGRTIVGGIYYVHGQPIHETSFSEDPEFPVQSSLITEMISARETPLFVKDHSSELPPAGIIVGEVHAVEDLNSWASKRKADMLLVGGSGFFTAVLDTVHLPSGNHNDKQPHEAGYPSLYIMGSAFKKSIEAVKKVKEEGGPVSYMPMEIINAPEPSDSVYRKWADEVITLISRYGEAIIAIEENSVKGTGADAKGLREKTAVVITHIVESITLHELYIEGGSTAMAVINKLNLKTFIPVKEWGTGVVRMKVPERNRLYLTIKPGSYAWPAETWKFNQPKYHT